ncbi:MAG: hypothetical protein LBD30_07295 [Verrucomicrobiales bacterium]|jgi:hypothetical protein|nr:hypothetical protein [Verrucomicrobiales bacterium]
MGVLIAESPGGLFAALLLFEERGVKYQPRRDQPKALAYPVFQLSPTALPDYKVGEEGPDAPAPDEALTFGAGK